MRGRLLESLGNNRSVTGYRGYEGNSAFTLLAVLLYH